MSAISSAVQASDCICPGCGKLTLLAREVLAIRATGLCFDCVPEDGLVELISFAPELAAPGPTTPEPSLDQLMAWEAEGYCEATDGCIVETDGVCPHGHPSWLVYLGFI